MTGLVTNAYRQVHLLYTLVRSVGDWLYLGHKCLSASTFTVHNTGSAVLGDSGWVTNAYRQVHLLYTSYGDSDRTSFLYVTNAYRQVHLLYTGGHMVIGDHAQSQMPIGKYIYCTPKEVLWKIFPQSHKCLSASTFTVHLSRVAPTCVTVLRHKCLSASTFTVHYS